MFALKKLLGGNLLSKDCLFEDVRGCIIDCYLPPNAENNLFMESDMEKTRMTENEILLQFGGIVKDLVE